MIIALTQSYLEDMLFQVGALYMVAKIFVDTFWIVLLVLSLIGRCFIFKKLNIAAWKGLIPFYGLLLLSKKTWSLKYCWVMFGCFAVWGLFDFFSYLTFESPLLYYFAIQIFVCNGIALVASLAMWFWCQYCVARSFGKGVGYAIGLFFISAIFNFILGLGKYKYVGNVFAAWESKTKIKIKKIDEEAYKKALEKNAKPKADVADEVREKPAEGKVKPEGAAKSDSAVAPEREAKPASAVKPQVTATPASKASPEREVKPACAKTPERKAKPVSKTKPASTAKPTPKEPKPETNAEKQPVISKPIQKESKTLKAGKSLNRLKSEHKKKNSL